MPTVFLARRVFVVAAFLKEENVASLGVISLAVYFQNAFAGYDVLERHYIRILSLVVYAVLLLSFSDYPNVYGGLLVYQMREVDEKFCHNQIRPVLLIIVISFLYILILPLFNRLGNFIKKF